MQLKSREDIIAVIDNARSTQGFASADDDVADKVMAICGSVNIVCGTPEAFSPAIIIALAVQLLPLIFGDGSFTIDKLISVLNIIKDVFI
jgi:hypothetical protein